jgi:predicted ribosome quality control (RQC) complex YloA/Tae2 family protein
MEAIVVKAVARELARELPARVQAILQPAPREILLVLRGAGERRLLLSADPEVPRLHLLGGRPATLPSPTAFCRLLRKHLEGRTLARVDCPGVERVVELAFSAPRAAAEELLLIAELMGKHSNLILVERATGTILDSLQHVGAPMSRVRTVQPGLPYTAPPDMGRPALDTLGAPAFSTLWNETGGKSGALLRRVLGLGPGMLSLAVARASLEPGFAADPGAAVHAELQSLRERVERGDYRPIFYPVRGILLPEPVPGWETEDRRDAPTMNAAAERYFAELIARRELARRREERIRELRKALAKLGAEEELRRREIADAGEAAFIQSAASALMVAADSFAKGSGTYRTEDPRNGAMREVTLDPKLGARANAEALYRRARKLRRRETLAAGKLPALAARRRLLEEELALVPTLSLEALSPQSPGRGAQREAGGATAKAAPGIREYRSPHGWRILVGKSGAGNDRLTGRIAAPEDYWFHVRDYPGAHVVLKGAGGEPPEEEIRAAASVAAWHSGARTERLVDVAYTKRKNVRKVKGGPPGKVLLSGESTVRVRPALPAGAEDRSA